MWPSDKHLTSLKCQLNKKLEWPCQKKKIGVGATKSDKG